MALLPSSIQPKPEKRPSRALVLRKPADALAAPISAFESEVSNVIIRTSPYSEHAILHAVGAIFVVVGILLSVIKVDEIIESTGGIIATHEGPIYVQPLNPGIIHQIMVRVGDVVKKGQVLATLDPTFTQADETQLTEHLASDQAMVDRLEAEQEGKPYVSSGSNKYEALQLTQWRQRQEEYKNTVAGYNAQIQADQALLVQAQRDVSNYTTRLKVNTDVEEMRKKIQASGWGSQLLTDQATDARAEVQRELEDAVQTVDQQTANINNLKAQLAVYIETWKDYIATNLVTTRNDLDQTQQALTKAAKLNQLITLTAPENAVVLQIASASIGSVVQTSTPNATGGQTQPLFTLTPLKDQVEAMLEIDSGDVAFIRQGDPVSVKIDAFPYIRFGNANGVVSTISDGSFTQDDSGAIRSPFYKVWVTITGYEFRNVPKDMRLLPGMTLTGDINVGKRTLMSYFISGMLRNATEAMREP